jgi:hypothetical protein
MYGVTWEEYEALLTKQEHCCAICKRPPSGTKVNSRLHVDHDHRTGKVRGLLCHSCNLVLGLMKESGVRLFRAGRTFWKEGSIARLCTRRGSQLTICPKCQKPDYSKQIAQVATDLREFHTPIEMYSIALNDDDEIKEFKRRAPDVDVATDPRDEMYGIPIARSRKQKLQALKAMEFTELN